MNIGENIKKYRLQKSMTQENLASIVGVSAQAVSKWECGESIPDGMLFIPLADALETSIDRLCGYEKVYENDVYPKIIHLIDDTPKNKRMEKSREICRQVNKGLCGAWKYDHHREYSSNEMDLLSVQDAFTDDTGFTFISHNHNMPFFSLFSEPDRGFGSAVKYDERYIEFFSSFGDEYVLKAFFNLYSKDEFLYTFEKEVLAEECGIPDDRIDDVMDKLDKLGIFLHEPLTHEINGENRTLYTVYQRHDIVAVFILITERMNNYHSEHYHMASTNRAASAHPAYLRCI